MISWLHLSNNLKLNVITKQRYEVTHDVLLPADPSADVICRLKYVQQLQDSFIARPLSNQQRRVWPSRHLKKKRTTTNATNWGEDVGTRYGFQVNERYLEWDDSAARQLIRLHVAKELDESVEETQQRLLELSILLPDLNEKLENMNVKLVLQLVRDTQATAQRLIDVKKALPNVNLSALVVSNPWLLTSPSPEELAAQMLKLENTLPDVAVERLIEAEPRLLLADIDLVLEEIQRLLPSEDPVRVLLIDPSIVLSMPQAGLQSSLAIDEGINAS